MPKVQQTGASNGGRRRGRGARVATSLAEINVVPLVDVMLVLLIIFMVTAPMMQQGLAVNLPQTRRADPVIAQPIYVTVPADFSRSRVVQINNDDVRIEILQERLRQALMARTDKSVFIRADAAATMQDFVDVTEKLKEAGVEKVGFMSQPRGRR
jgi:biopolymer transport protein TolR